MRRPYDPVRGLKIRYPPENPMRTAAMGAGEVAAVRMERSYPPGRRDPGNWPSCWGSMTAGPRDTFIIGSGPLWFCEIVHKRA